MSKKQGKIIRVRFSDDWTMMFGDSYKPWEIQLEEYLSLLKQKGKLNGYLDVSVSNNKWISWGGLKWCSEENFQQQLNREGCQFNDPDNPHPRKYKEMSFYKDGTVTRKVNKLFEKLSKNLY